MTRPPDLSDHELTSALREGWGLVVASIEYRPVGFGSHHWEAVDTDKGRWFVTVDEDPPIERLRAALATAGAVRDAGLDFAGAPVFTANGEPLFVVGRFAVACYPYLDGESCAWDDPPPAYYDAILEMLVALHTAPASCRLHALNDEFAIAGRDALLDPDIADAGPYSQSTHALLAEHRDTLRDALARYDALVATADEQPTRVLTHGEPHPGNTMRTPDGWKLIDWDTVLVAAPERDLWDLEGLQSAYEDATKTTLRPSLLELYRRRWYLGDIAVYVRRFRAPHGDADDDVKSWQGLQDDLAHLSEV